MHTISHTREFSTHLPSFPRDLVAISKAVWLEYFWYQHVMFPSLSLAQGLSN